MKLTVRETVKKLSPGTIVKILRCHHIKTEDCVGKLGKVNKIVLKNSIYRIKIEDQFWLFGARDLEIISAYEMLAWK